MNKKQTAVNFLVNYMLENFHLTDESLEVFEQAKQIEKAQMIKFALHLHQVDCSKTGADILNDEAEQYYNETYSECTQQS